MKIINVKKYVACLVGRLFILTVLLSPISISFAATDTFMPYAYARSSYNSNLFRLADDAEAVAVLGDTDKNETIRHLGAGFRIDLPVSRQRLILDAEMDRVDYDTFSTLNHTRTEARTAWHWQVGNLWSGNLGYRYSKRLSTFYELQSVSKDMKTKNNVFLDAGYQIHPDWRLLAGVSRSDQGYQEREALDSELRSKKLEIQYKNTINTRMGLRATVTDANLLNLENIDGTLFNNDYEKTEISGIFYWEGTGKSHFEARLGVTDQKYNELTERDSQDTVGRLTYLWLLTGKTKLDVSLWRETDSRVEEITTLVVTEGVSISPTWSATRKITVSGKISYEQDDFKGENEVILISGQKAREDEIRLFLINVNYNPTRNLSLSLGYQTEERTSNRKDSEFDYKQVDAKVQFSF